jgi:ABC-type antimicrobial peptide transport system permease subunit
MMLRQSVILVAIGFAAGLAGSIGAGRLLLAAFPTGDDGRDPVALALVAPAVLAVAMLAAYLPARRAARINPTEALRYE